MPAAHWRDAIVHPPRRRPPGPRRGPSHIPVGGVRLPTADTAIDALRHLQNGEAPDLAILDTRIPDWSGTKLALRINGQYPNIPVLFVAGWAEAVDVDHVGALRWEFLQKPYTPETLLPAVKRLLAGNWA